MTEAAAADHEEFAMTVRSLAGSVLAQLHCVPATVSETKDALEQQTGVPAALQKLILDGRVIGDDEALDADVSADIVLVVDETPIYYWDLAGNPDRDLLRGEGGEVFFTSDSVDYVNVVTQAPITSGVHFFEFYMHVIGDEQWCGLALNKDRAGHRGSLAGYFYYCGHRRGRGALHAPRERVEMCEFEFVSNGDVIGLLLDADKAIAVFLRNGIVQGGCTVPKSPLFLTTCLDEKDDHVVLSKPALAEVPQEAFQELAKLEASRR